MAFDRKGALSAGVVGAVIGIAVSLAWLLVSRQLLTSYHLDAGDLVYYWHPSPNPAATWLAYGPLPFFTAAGLIVFQSMAGGKGERARGLAYVTGMLAGFLLWLSVSVAMLWGHVALGLDIFLYTGDLFVVVVLCVLLGFRYLARKRDIVKPLAPKPLPAENAFTPILLAVALMAVLYVLWVYCLPQLLLLAGFGLERTYDLFLHVPALDWLRTGAPLPFMMLSFFLAYALLFRGKPELGFIVKAFRAIALYSVMGFFLWLVLSVSLSLLPLAIAPTITSGAGNVFLVLLLVYEGGHIFPDLATGRVAASKPESENTVG